MTMLAGLVNYYDRLEETGAVASPGYSSERIGFALVLRPDGSVIDPMTLRDETKKKPEPRILTVPASFKRPGTTSKPFFLWDKTSYVFGVVNTVAKTSAKDPMQDHRAFVSFHEEMLADADDEGLLAVLRFLRGWSPDRYAALRHADDMLDQNVVFRLGDELGYVHERPAAKSLWASHQAGADVKRGSCLVTGAEDAPIARLHPSIKGVPGAQTAGASLVSFNLDAFTSYGKEQGENSPVSERGAHAYGTALNTLLSASQGRDPKTNRPYWTNRVQVGDATTVFWAAAEGGPAALQNALRAERTFAATFDPTPPTDEEEAARMAAILEHAEAGRPIEDLKALGEPINPKTEFYVLGVSPNAARLSVRFFLQKEFGEVYANLQRHLADLRLEPSAWKTRPPSGYMLTLQTAVMRRKDDRVSADAKTVPSNLAGETVRAILEGRHYPQALLATVIERMKGDRIVSSLRVALVKASIARRWRLFASSPYGPYQERTLVTLDPEHPSQGYQLGRLFATYERAQAACYDNVNAGLVDKYFASAMATPQYVFPSLCANFQNHRRRIEKGNNLAKWLTELQRRNKDFTTKGYAASLNRRVADIMARFGGAIPAQLSIDEQGLFAIGYYHQKFHRSEGPAATVEPSEAEIEPSSEGDEDA